MSDGWHEGHRPQSPHAGGHPGDGNGHRDRNRDRQGEQKAIQGGCRDIGLQVISITTVHKNPQRRGEV